MLQHKQLLGKFRLESTLLLETGMHIGGGGEKLDIGGLDKAVVRTLLPSFHTFPVLQLKANCALFWSGFTINL